MLSDRIADFRRLFATDTFTSRVANLCRIRNAVLFYDLTVMSLTAKNRRNGTNEYRLSLTEEPKPEIKKRNSFLQDYPVKDMQKRTWLSKTDDFEKLTSEIEKFFAEGVDSHGVERSAFFKRTIKESSLNSAEKAWLHRARHLAQLLPATKYNEKRLPDLFEKLKAAAKSSESVKHIAGLLQRYGIRFVVIEPIPRSMIDAASFWLDDATPVIVMSLRYDNVGSFFYGLIHELFHIKHKDGTSCDNFTDDDVGEIEQERRNQAGEFLVNPEQLAKFIKDSTPYYYPEAIIEFATKIGVHPGIVVGQLQKRGEIEYNAHRALMAKVRQPVILTAFTDGWGRPIPSMKFEEIA